MSESAVLIQPGNTTMPDVTVITQLPQSYRTPVGRINIANITCRSCRKVRLPAPESVTNRKRTRP